MAALEETGAFRCAAHLDDVAVGVLGVGAHIDREEGRDVVVRRDLPQGLVEVIFVPGVCDIPAAKLGKENPERCMRQDR